MSEPSAPESLPIAEPRGGHFLTIEEWSGRKPRRLSVPGMKNGRQRIIVEFEDGDLVTVSSTSVDRAWDVLRRRLILRAVPDGVAATSE